MAAALQTGQPVEKKELRIQRFNGSEGYVLVSAAPIKDREGRLLGVVGINLDITERKQAEDDLRASEAALDAFFQQSPGILNLFDKDLCYINTDPITPTYFNLDRQGIVGKSVWDLNPPFAEQFLDPMLQRITQTQQPELNLEVPGPVPSSKAQWAFGGYPTSLSLCMKERPAWA